MAEKLFTEFPPISTKEWEEVIAKDLKGADYNKRLIWKTVEGIEVNPYYRAEDLEGLGHIGSEPGAYPFVRGTKKDNRWLIRESFSTKEGISKANREAVDSLSKGGNSVAFSLKGRERLTTKEIGELLNGIDLLKAEVNFVGCNCLNSAVVENFIKYGVEQKINLSRVKVSFDFDPFGDLTSKGNYSCNNALESLKEAVELTKEYPSIRVVGVTGYLFNDAGATIVEELAFSLASGSEYLQLLREGGISAECAASTIKFSFAVGSNYFMEIAKFRAARVLWANIVKGYGAESEESQKMVTHAITSQWNMTLYDPFVNMLRGTTEAMSAALAGVDSIEVRPFDHTYSEPTELSSRVARNSQIILKEEANLDKVTDPAGGSYYIENLTASIIEQGWKLFLEVEKMGGYREALKENFIQTRVKESSNRRDLNIATRREILLGTNQFPNFTESSPKEATLDVVTRGANSTIAQEKMVEPIESYRGAQAFEALRFATESSGKNPKVFMLTFGNLAFCRARAQFASNFFAVAGYAIQDNNRFASIEEGVEEAIKAEANLVVACSSDAEYCDTLPKIKELLGDKAILVVAGEPACKEELISAGIENFISVKSNLLETLKGYQIKLGIE